MDTPNGPTLIGKLTVLRPISETDYKVLYTWRSDPEWLYLWSHPRRLVSYPEFVSNLEKSLRAEIDIWLLVTSRTDEHPIGFVYTYDTSHWDGYSFLCSYIDPRHRSKGVGREATAMFVRYLMDYFPLRKLYADVFEFNAVSQTFVEEYGFVEEGVFALHRYYQGKYWTLRRLALYREKWEAIKPAIFARAEPSDSPNN